MLIIFSRDEKKKNEPDKIEKTRVFTKVKILGSAGRRAADRRVGGSAGRRAAGRRVGGSVGRQVGRSVGRRFYVRRQNVTPVVTTFAQVLTTRPSDLPRRALFEVTGKVLTTSSRP